TSDGAVYCWGLYLGPNFEKQPIACKQPIDDAISLDVADYAVCFVRRSGRVVCRGHRGYLTGRPSTGFDFISTEIEGLGDIRSIHAGAVHVCAVEERGVWCWGSDDRGESSTVSGSARSNPVHIDLPDIRSLALGAAHSCALTTDHRVLCWGG